MYFYTNAKAHISLCDIQCSHNLIPAEIIDWFHPPAGEMLIKVLSGLDPGEHSSVSHLGSPSSLLAKSFLHNSPKTVRLLKQVRQQRIWRVVQHSANQQQRLKSFLNNQISPGLTHPLQRHFKAGTNLCGWRINLHCREWRAELELELGRAKGCMNINQLYWGKWLWILSLWKSPEVKLKPCMDGLSITQWSFSPSYALQHPSFWFFFPSHWKICNLMAKAPPWQRSDKSLKSMEPRRDKAPRSLSAMWGTAHHCCPSPCWPTWCLCVCPTKVRHLRSQRSLSLLIPKGETNMYQGTGQLFWISWSSLRKWEVNT